MEVSLKPATYYNTPCHWVAIGPVQILFSYQTAIAFNSPFNRVRVPNCWGPTTGRHFNEAGVRDWTVVSREEFEILLQGALGKVQS